MTDEQIKQNAEEYANKVNTFAEDESVYFAAKDGYVSGAHSRDEEIAGYQMQINMTADALQPCMTSEEIIERLIDEKKLSVKEAMVIMKDLAEENVRRMFYAENSIHRYSSPWYDVSSIAVNDPSKNNFSTKYNTKNESK